MQVWVIVVLLALPAWLRADNDSPKPQGGPLARWRNGVKMRPVSEQPGRHTIHSYFNTSPESPDGRWVLFFASTAADGQSGEVRILERATGQEKVVARNVTTEDAHRAACQQWSSRGRRVVFHDLRGGEWMVVAVDVETLQERVLARGRQLAFGQPGSELVPIYGMHWNPGTNRDLELLNVETGEIRTAVTADAVKAAYPDWVAKAFGEKPVSIFFPILSLDAKRVFFKMASPAGGDFRSKQASTRSGLVCYDLEKSRFLSLRGKWGHPAWLPDSRTILEVPTVLINSDTGAAQRIPGLPNFSGSHPSPAPAGQLFVTDCTLGAFGGKETEWGVAVAALAGKEFAFLHRFDNSHGAKSWRRSHPHPVFSPDGNRIYFNVSSGEWTQLFVAEIGPWISETHSSLR